MIILSILEVVIILLLIFLRKRILIAIAPIKDARRGGRERRGGGALGAQPGRLSLMSVSVPPQGCGTCHVLPALPTGDLLPLVSLHCLLGQHFCVSTPHESGVPKDRCP